MQQSALCIIDGTQMVYIVAGVFGKKKRAYTMHTVCICGKLLQSRDVFYSTIKQQSLFFKY